jgi:hypothetical protein
MLLLMMMIYVTVLKGTIAPVAIVVDDGVPVSLLS